MKNFVLIACASLLLASCNTNELEFDNIKVEGISGVYAFPLGTRSYTMRELIEDQGDNELDLQEDSTSLLTLFYRDSISYNADGEFVEIENVESNAIVSVPANPAVGVVTQVDFSQEFTREYEPENGEQVTEVFYSAGDLEISIASTLANQLDYTITITNTVEVATDNPVQFTGAFNGAGNNTFNQPLAGYKTTLEVDPGDPTNFNTFRIDFEGTVTLQPGESLAGGDAISFDIAYRDQEFSLVYGFFGRDTVQVGNQTLDIEFFREIGEEGLFFGNPIMRFDFRNQFGIPVGVDFSGMFGDDGAGGNQTFLSGSITEAPLPEIAAATAPGETTASTIEIRSDNSNIVGLLATSPARLVFDVNGISNANDEPLNFVQPGNEIEGFIELEVPMEIRLEDLVQSFDFDLGDGLDTENVDSAFIRVVTVNELPFAAVLDLEIQDADSNVLHTVLDNQIMNAPFIDINGLVTDPSGFAGDIPLGPEGVEALENGTRIVMRATLNTPISQTSRVIFVKVLADYQLDITIGVGGLVNIDI